MIEVEAIKKHDQIASIHTLLQQQGEHFADTWKLGINVALRISDLLSIKYSDLDLDRKELEIIEGKTKKLKIAYRPLGRSGRSRSMTSSAW